VLNAEETLAGLTPWVTLMNVSGVGFKNAQLKLIAGDVQKIQPTRDIMMRSRGMVAEAASPMGGGFEEESLFEYHLYTLPRPTDVLTNTTQQLVLFPPVAAVPVVKELVYQGLPDYWHGAGLIDQQDPGFPTNTKVGVYLRIENDEKSSLGMPLPAGRVRVYKMSGGEDGTLEFVGEDIVDHTARNASVRLKLGNSFDVTGERTATDFSVDQRRKTMTESFRITLKNGKNAPQRVTVRESLYRWTNWEITATSPDFRKVDARTITFDVEVPAGGLKSVDYTVKYTW